MATSETTKSAAPTAASVNSSNTFAASVNLSGSPLKAVLVISGVSMAGFAVVKLINKHCRERKIEVTEK